MNNMRQGDWRTELPGISPYDHLPAFSHRGYDVEARAQMPRGGTDIVWGIRVDDTWYLSDIPAHVSDTKDKIEKAVIDWVNTRFPA